MIKIKNLTGYEIKLEQVVMLHFDPNTWFYVLFVLFLNTEYILEQK